MCISCRSSRRTVYLGYGAVQVWSGEKESLLQGVSAMPHKYEREIEEILRNMERPEPQKGIGDRVRSFQRPATRARRRGPRMSLRLNGSEALLFAGIALALVAAGMAYYLTAPNALTGGIAIAGFVLIVVALLRSWSSRFSPAPPQRSSTPVWRPTVVDSAPTRVRRRNPFSEIATQFRILRLKFRYWRSKGR